VHSTATAATQVPRRRSATSQTGDWARKLPRDQCLHFVSTSSLLFKDCNKVNKVTNKVVVISTVAVCMRLTCSCRHCQAYIVLIEGSIIQAHDRNDLLVPCI